MQYVDNKIIDEVTMIRIFLRVLIKLNNSEKKIINCKFLTNHYRVIEKKADNERFNSCLSRFGNIVFIIPESVGQCTTNYSSS